MGATRGVGFYGPVDSFEGSGESLVVADPDEALGSGFSGLRQLLLTNMNWLLIVVNSSR